MNAQNSTEPSQNDSDYCIFGAKALLNLLTVFRKQIDGVIKNDDPEYVHKTRVTSRRIRATMPLFRVCFQPKDFMMWIREIKKVTHLLGEARDLDVQINFIEKYIEKIDSVEEKAGIAPIFKAHIKRRKRIQLFVVNELEILKKTGVLDNLQAFCERNVKEQGIDACNLQLILEKARWHTFFRLDDFLEMENYVHEEQEAKKHHEMRIYAKKLRYTMQTFAPLYQNKLTQEIETIKAFQDVLGEMHDFEVWIEYIPKFLQEINTKNKLKQKRKTINKTNQPLLNFLDFVKEKRKEKYGQFVCLWDQNKKKKFFTNLRKTINSVVPANCKEKKIHVIENPFVKIAILSDIHANLHALESVIQDAETRGAELFVNAGDSIGFGPCPNEVAELLCEKDVLSILGNYDLEVMESKTKAEKNISLKFARREMTKATELYLYSLPHELRINVAGKKILVAHGSPESIEEHIYVDTQIERLKAISDSRKVDVIIIGHSHEQFWRQVDETCFINPGSVGRPNDGNRKAGYAILSFNPLKVELFRVDYDVKAATAVVRRKGLPESFAQMLLRGVSIDTIIKEDQKKDTVQDYEQMAKVSRQISKRYWPDMDHADKVGRLSLDLFDGLIKIHKLGIRERFWLECAAILHDVGLSKSRTNHQKKSAQIILNDIELPFTSEDRRIIASIARYHRKKLPRDNHYNLATLNLKTRQKVKILASLLRIADSLDYTHQSIVTQIIINIGNKRITVEFTSKIKPTLEEQAFNKKKNLFEKVFNKKVGLVWKQPLKPQDM